MAQQPLILTLYVREHCHLCEDMLAALEAWQAERALLLETRVVDIDADPILAARYGERVPVLAAMEREICHYRLDPAAVDAYFAEIR